MKMDGEIFQMLKQLLVSIHVTVKRVVGIQATKCEWLQSNTSNRVDSAFFRSVTRHT